MRFLLTALAVVLGLGSCGGDAGSCGRVEPCGGDVTGAWNVQTACPADVFAIPAVLGTVLAACTGLTDTPSPVASLSGTWTFGADGTYERTGTLTTRFETTFPLSCASSSAGCADLAPKLRSQPQVQSASCTWVQQQCICDSVVTADVGERGTFSISDMMLSLTPMSGQRYSKEYCVQDNQLHIIDSGGFALPGNHIADDIVGVRQ